MIPIPFEKGITVALIKTQVELHPVSGVPEDIVVNTWHFETDDSTTASDAAHAINGVLASAYTRTDPGVGNAFGEFISGSISRATLPTLKSYVIDVDDGLSITGPIEDTFASLNNPLGAGPLPREVALCLSYHADLTDLAEDVADGPDVGTARDRPASRNRGRVYLGPLSQAALTAGTDSRPGNGVIQAALAMGTYLLSAPAPFVTHGVNWVVYSRQMRAAIPVTGAWVDNEWDTQRRRGLRRTSRSTTGTGL